MPRVLAVFACVSPDQDKIFLSVDARRLSRCSLRDGSLETIIDMSYDNLNGIKFYTGMLPVAHYMLPCVESLLRIRPRSNLTVRDH